MKDTITKKAVPRKQPPAIVNTDLCQSRSYAPANCADKLLVTFQ